MAQYGDLSLMFEIGSKLYALLSLSSVLSKAHRPLSRERKITVPAYSPSSHQAQNQKKKSRLFISLSHVLQ